MAAGIEFVQKEDEVAGQFSIKENDAGLALDNLPGQCLITRDIRPLIQPCRRQRSTQEGRGQRDSQNAKRLDSPVGGERAHRKLHESWYPIEAVVSLLMGDKGESDVAGTYPGQ